MILVLPEFPAAVHLHVLCITLLFQRGIAWVRNSLPSTENELFSLFFISESKWEGQKMQHIWDFSRVFNTELSYSSTSVLTTLCIIIQIAPIPVASMSLLFAHR